MGRNHDCDMDRNNSILRLFIEGYIQRKDLGLISGVASMLIMSIFGLGNDREGVIKNIEMFEEPSA